jgi:hypothetical protein
MKKIKKYKYLVDREFDMGCVWFRYTGTMADKFVNLEQKVSCETKWRSDTWDLSVIKVMSGKSSVKPCKAEDIPLRFRK